MRRRDSLAPALPFDGWLEREPRRGHLTRAAFEAWVRRARIPFDAQRQVIVASDSTDMNDKGWRIVSRLALEADGKRRMATVETWTHGRRRGEAADRRRA